MRKFLLVSTALTLGTISPALAGGPAVVVEEETPVVAENPASSGGMLVPLLLIGVVIAVAVSGNNDSPPVVSDIRLKEDIRRVGRNHLGLGVYQYRYKGFDGTYEGVMAQEVEIMHPGAIRRLPAGFKGVDYARLGLSLRRVA